MTEMVLNTNTLPEPLFSLISTEKVRVSGTGKIVILTPIDEDVKKRLDLVDELYGFCEGSSLTVDKLLALTHDETEMGQ